MSANDTKLTRRTMVRGGVALGLAVVAPARLLAGCGGDDAPTCLSPAGITPDERQKRAQFSYVEPAADQARRCDLCSFYLQPPQGEACGPCTLGLGAVHPNGTCTAFAPRG